MGDKWEKLQDFLTPLVKEGLCVAFSAGVDSSLLLWEAVRCAKRSGGRVRAVTFSTALHPSSDEGQARRVAAEIGAPLEIIQVDEFENPRIMENPPDRCYHCKYMLFRRLKDFAAGHGYGAAADGTNFDDTCQYRPGLRALKELGIYSPLARCGIRKEDVRQRAGRIGLSVSQKPSSPCLATRLPYGAQITKELLGRIEEGEKLLAARGFPVNRLRAHGDVARIEVPPDRFADFSAQAREISGEIRALGFFYAALDLEGFASGSMDKPLLRDKEEKDDDEGIAGGGQ